MEYAIVVDDGSVFDVSVLAQIDPARLHLTFIADCYHAEARLTSEPVDVLILSTYLDRNELCRRVRTNPVTSQLPVICLSKSDDLQEKLRYFRMGADDFLVAPFDGRELSARVTAVVNRARWESRHANVFVAAGGQLKFDTRKKTLEVDDTPLHLTRLEYSLVYYLIRVAGNFVSTDELLEHVWGYSKGTGDPALVRAQIKNLRKKLQDVNPETNCLHSAPGLGYQIAL